MALTMKQRAKVNAALCLIHSHGYAVGDVTAWAMDYMRKGYGEAKAYQNALNEFLAGQPDLLDGVSKVTRLVEASDNVTVAKYDSALSAFIETGDDTALMALAPVIAQDSIALAKQNGELPDGALSAANAEEALGFAMADAPLAQAFQHGAYEAASGAAQEGAPVGTHQGQAQQTPQAFPGFNTGVSSTAPQAQPGGNGRQAGAPGAGIVVGQRRQEGYVGSSASGSLLGLNKVQPGFGVAPQQHAFKTKDEIKAGYASAGVIATSETI